MRIFAPQKLTFYVLSTLTLAGVALNAKAYYIDSDTIVISNGEHKVVNTPWNIEDNFKIYVGHDDNGYYGDGHLTIDSGGEVKTQLIQIGRFGGNGQVDIINGGKLTIDHQNYSNPLVIGGSDNDGQSTGSTGILNIIGQGSELTYINTRDVGTLSVGMSGAHGILNVLDGGKMTLGNTSTSEGLWIGSRGNSNTKGIVNVDGEGSLIHNMGRLLVGTYNEGQLHVTNGGKVYVSNYISVGRAVSDRTIDNIMTVSGQDSHIHADSYVDIGYGGKGTVIVSDNGKLSATHVIIANSINNPGELAIGSRAGQAATAAGVLDVDYVRFGIGKGTLVFNHTNNDYEFAPRITGNGTVDLLSGKTIFTGANDYTGPTTIGENARLQAGALNTFSPASNYTILANGQVDLNGYSQTIQNLNNAGTLYLGQNASAAGTTLHIIGNYVGQNGTIVMNGALAGDTSSTTDLLDIGGNATGTTHVAVQNLGGSGAPTIEGIKIINVNGTSDPDAFVQQGRIVAGAYEYQLVQGDASATDPQSWYLTSQYATPPAPPTPPPPPGPPVPPTPPVPPEPPAPPAPPGLPIPTVPPIYTVRPEGGAYLSNLNAANIMFNLSLHDRHSHKMAQNNSDSALTPWIRYSYNSDRFEDSSQQISTKGHYNVVQIGMPLLERATDQGQISLGIMAGYGSHNSSSKNGLNNYTASGKIQGYNAGIYATWLAQPEEGGAYIDTWLMWNHLKGEVNGEGLPQEDYHLNGLSASVEAGYAINLGQIRQNNIWLEPQAQLTWMGVKPNNHTETNGTRISGQGNNLQTRIGARLYTSSAPNKARTNAIAFTPYVEANWLHNTRPFKVEMDNITVGPAGSNNLAEVRVGSQATFNSNSAFWFDLGYQVGTHGYTNSEVRIGFKHSF